MVIHDLDDLGVPPIDLGNLHISAVVKTNYRTVRKQTVQVGELSHLWQFYWGR